MMDSVAGAPASPMPAPMRTSASARRPYPVPVVSVAATARPVANSSMPVVVTRLVPKRRTSFDERGAKTIMAVA